MSRLLKVTFECKVITPMFLGGADGSPELRVTGFKSEMRFWLRALLGGILNEDSKKVAEIEQVFFGGTKGNGSQSTILMSLNYSEENFEVGKKPLLPHKSGNSVAMKKCIMPETLFCLVFKTSRGKHVFRDNSGKEIASIDKETLFNISLDLFRFVSILGTVGQRSNRGFGSFSIVSEHSKQFSKINEISEEIKKSKSKLTESLKELSNSISLETKISLETNKVSKWPILHDKVSQISIGNEVNWDKFIKQLMNSIHDEMVRGNLKPKVLGGISPRQGSTSPKRQGSTMKVSMVQVNNNHLVPVITNFITQTDGKPTRKDYSNILQFPQKKLGASIIKL